MTEAAGTNMFDLIVFGVLGLSALLSFFRGFVREVLSLGAWVGASIITLYAFPDVAKWVEPQVGSEGVASGIAALGTFMTALIVISLFNRLLIRLFKSGSEIGLLDNGLGLLFGLLRGGLLVALGYYSMTLVVAKDAYPEWFKGSLTRPYVEKGASWIGNVAPSYLSEIHTNKNKKETPELDKLLQHDKKKTDADWQSMDELQRRMREEENAR